MIELTRLNGNPMLLNSDLIKTAEASPDTMLTLINGEKIIVRESLDQILECVQCYRAKLLASVAQELSSERDLQQAASLTSLRFELGPSAAPDSYTGSDHFPGDPGVR